MLRLGRHWGELRGQGRGSTFLFNSPDLVLTNLGAQVALVEHPRPSQPRAPSPGSGADTDFNVGVQRRLGKWDHRGPSYTETQGWAGGERKSILEEVAWALGLEGEVIPHSVCGWKVFQGRVGRCVGVSSGAIWLVQRREPDGGLGPKVGETWNGS